MADIVGDNGDENRDKRLSQEFAAVPVRDKALARASRLFELVDILLGAKAGTGIFPVRCEHPDLGDVGEEAVYGDLRRRLLDNLRQSERPDLLDHADRLLPDRVYLVTTGKVAWDQNDVEDLRSKLDAACTEAGLDRYRALCAQCFRTELDKVCFIADQTEQEQAGQRPVLDPSAGERFAEKLAEFTAFKPWTPPLPYDYSPAPPPNAAIPWLEPTDEVLSPPFVVEPFVTPTKAHHPAMTQPEVGAAMDLYLLTCAENGSDASKFGFYGELRYHPNTIDRWMGWWGTNYVTMRDESSLRIAPQLAEAKATRLRQVKESQKRS